MTAEQESLKLAELTLQLSLTEQRLKNATRMYVSFAEERSKICQALAKRGLRLESNNTIVEVSPPQIPESTTSPVTLWYRIIKDEDGNDAESFNHYDDGDLFDQQIPPPRAGQKFPGRWVKKLGWKIGGLVPKIQEGVDLGNVH